MTPKIIVDQCVLRPKEVDHNGLTPKIIVDQCVLRPKIIVDRCFETENHCWSVFWDRKKGREGATHFHVSKSLS